MQVKPGYEIKLVASEPLVQDPVFIDGDEMGRAWGVEMGDSPFAPGEKTNDGKVGQGRVSDLQTDRISLAKSFLNLTSAPLLNIERWVDESNARLRKSPQHGRLHAS